MSAAPQKPPPGWVVRNGLLVPDTTSTPPVFNVVVQGFAPPSRPKPPKRAR